MGKIFFNRRVTRIGCMVSYFKDYQKIFWFKNDFKPYNMMCSKNL